MTMKSDLFPFHWLKRSQAPHVRKLSHLLFANLYLISVETLMVKAVQTRPHYLSRTLLFLFPGKKTGRGTILLEILGISFNKKKYCQQNQFPSSFPFSSNNWLKPSLLEHTKHHLQQPIDLRETGNYWCFPICLNKWMTYQRPKCELLYFLCSITKSMCQLGQD